MNKILIDTMHIESMLSKDPAYLELIDAIDDGKIMGISSVVTLTELIKNLGKKDFDEMQKTIRQLMCSEIILLDVTQDIAVHAGELRLKYNIPTIDSIIAATAMVENIKHVLTYDRRHFEPVKKIKIIDLKTAIGLSR